MRNKRKEKWRQARGRAGPDARVRTMAMTVKFKSAEIYNGRWLGARALTRMNAASPDREVSVTCCRKSAGDDATRHRRRCRHGARPLLLFLFFHLRNEREGSRVPRDTRGRFINVWARMVTTRAIPVYGICGHLVYLYRIATMRIDSRARCHIGELRDVPRTICKIIEREK